MSKAEKTPLMIEWYTKVINHMLTHVKKIQDASGPEAFTVKKAVANNKENSELRRGVIALIDLLWEKGIDFVIVSAGWADVIEELLECWGVERK